MRRASLIALLAFVLLTLAFTWPLALHLSTHLTGPPSGDTGVYVWNIWVFRHELMQNGRLPFLTSQIFSLDASAADLSLHNYTTFADLIAVPLIPLLGVVATFNAVYLLNLVLTAFAAFLLARHETGRTAEAWLGGALFAFSPALIARGTGHFSLTEAAALPVFVLMLARAYDTQRLGYGVALGLTVAWAMFSDPYYAVYCLIIAVCFLAWRLFSWRVRRAEVEARRLRFAWVLDALILCAAGFVVGIVIRRGGRLDVLGLRVSLRTLYTPMLVLMTLLLARLALWLRPYVAPRTGWRPGYAAKLLAVTGMVALIPLAPTLYALALRVRAGQYVSAPVLWRSSAPGVDALAFFMPNPNHPWFGGPWREWLATRPGGFIENVASVGLVTFAVVLWAAARRLSRVSRFWVFLTVVSAALALGPFVVVGGVNTGIPTPWTLLRYVPIVTSARMPARFTVLVMLGCAVLFAQALSAVTRRYAARRGPILAVVGLALLFELAPAPRPLYSAAIPAVYRIIAADPRPVRVLELPFGIRDGLSSTGNFSAAAQFHQTAHGKPIIGGYLSRVSPRRVHAYRRIPVLDALLTLSEGKTPTPEQVRRAYRRRDMFLDSARLGYVVVNRDQTSPALRDFAIDLLHLKKLSEADGCELYVPAPPCR